MHIFGFIIRIPFYLVREYVTVEYGCAIQETKYFGPPKVKYDIFIVSPCIFIYLLVFTDVCTFIVIKILHKQSLM
jgi:hypothetical protein